jgi:hypothetical protein
MYNLDNAKKSGLVKEDHFNRGIRQAGREHEQTHKHWRKEYKRLQSNNITLMIDEESGALAEVDKYGNMVKKYGDEGPANNDREIFEKMAQQWLKEDMYRKAGMKVEDKEEDEDEESMEERDAEEGGDDDDDDQEEDEDIEEYDEDEEDDDEFDEDEDDDEDDDFDEDDDDDFDEDDEFDEDEDFEDDEEYEEGDKDDERMDKKKDRIKEFEVEDDEDEFDEKIGRGPRSGGRGNQ